MNRFTNRNQSGYRGRERVGVGGRMGSTIPVLKSLGFLLAMNRVLLQSMSIPCYRELRASLVPFSQTHSVNADLTLAAITCNFLLISPIIFSLFISIEKKKDFYFKQYRLRNKSYRIQELRAGRITYLTWEENFNHKIQHVFFLKLYFFF